MSDCEVGLGLGANIGDKAGHLRRALRELAADGAVRVTAMSSLYRTAPWGPIEQEFFANACTLARTRLAPLDLLDHIKAVEARMGREPGVRWGPRLIDIDILFYGDVTLASPRLTLPHPEMLNRAFVMIPLAEIAPEREIGGRKLREWANQAASQGVEPWRA